MKTLLKLDYDSKELLYYFRNHVGQLYRIYFIKRTILPKMHVKKIIKTNKGYHIYIAFEDNNSFNTKQAERLFILLIQTLMGSDIVRSGFDALRVTRNTERWNILFTYKKGKSFKREDDLVPLLNKIILDIKTFYEA
jgi:hypothetical protein